MAWVVNETLTPNCENDVEAGTATNDFVDDGEIPERSNPKPKSSMLGWAWVRVMVRHDPLGRRFKSWFGLGSSVGPHG